MAIPIYVFIPPPADPAKVREAHPYGPNAADPMQPFFENLGVEVHTTINDESPFLAVTDGHVWVLPPAGAPIKRDLVLIPSPTVWSSLTESVFDKGSIVFVYRGLSSDMIRDAFLPFVISMRDTPVPQMSDSDRLDRFTQGEFPIFVQGGTPLGRGRPDGNWVPIKFEIVFIPSLEVKADGPGWRRLQELVLPGTATRRYDPASFYAAVVQHQLLEFALNHTNHPLLLKLTPRTLLEIRDEYDDPYVGTVRVQDHSGPTDHMLDPGSRGTVVLADPGVGGNPVTDEYTVTIENHVFTSLPSGQAAAADPMRLLTTPSHWGLQSIFMADVEDPANWFAANAQGWQRFTANNRVRYLIDGIPTFRAIVDHLRATGGANSFLLLAGWSFDDSFRLVPDDPTSTFHNLTTEMAQRGVEIRGIFWLNLHPERFNLAVRRINNLPGGKGQAFTDSIIRRTLLSAGSHHQKCMIVQLASGMTTAFCGGIDIFINRVDDTSHRSNPPYHDVHAQVDGPAVLELFETLRRRWDTNPAAPAPLPFAPAQVETSGPHFVQVTRIYAPRLTVPYKQPGEDLGTLRTLRRAVQRATQFIYLEDQFVTPYAGGFPPLEPGRDSTGIVQDLLAALNKATFKALIIVLPNHADLPQHRYRRQQFIKVLKDAHPEKIFIFYLVRHRRFIGDSDAWRVGPIAAFDSVWDPQYAELSYEAALLKSKASGSPKYPDEIFVHSKVWIIDDVYVKIGSSNVNRRSMTHDSEADIHIIDAGVINARRRFARSLRIDLWGEHLNIPPVYREAKLEDPIGALYYWQNRPSGARIRPYKENLEIERLRTNRMWDKWDPDGQL